MSKSFNTSSVNRKTVALDTLIAVESRDNDAGMDELKDLLLSRLRLGGCAVVVCNTVGEAQRIYATLRFLFPELADDGEPELDLLHSRFMFEHRADREKRSLRRFGKDGKYRPRRSVLIATQIVEQSLDLDFDFMITDLAPVDLVLQRMGRLHRHERNRPERLNQPVLVIRMPPLDEEGAPKFPEAWKRVYDAQHILLRSWLALREKSSINIPGDVEDLIEAVYDDRSCPQGLEATIQTLWRETFEQTTKLRRSEKEQASERLLKRPLDVESSLWRMTEAELEEEDPKLHKAFQALTRLADPGVDVVLGFPEDPIGNSVPNLTEVKRILRRSLRITDPRVVHAIEDFEPPSGWRKSALLRRYRTITLNTAGETQINGYTLAYSQDLGLQIQRTHGG